MYILIHFPVKRYNFTALWIQQFSDTWIVDTWSGFQAAKTAPWPSQGLHHFGKVLEPTDEWAGRGCCCFLMRWHSWAFLAHQEWTLEICRAQIWIFQFSHFRCLSEILATGCSSEAQTQLLYFLIGTLMGFCLLDIVFHVLCVFCFLFCVPFCHQYLAPHAVLFSKYI